MGTYRIYRKNNFTNECFSTSYVGEKKIINKIVKALTNSKLNTFFMEKEV